MDQGWEDVTIKQECRTRDTDKSDTFVRRVTPLSSMFSYLDSLLLHCATLVITT